MKHLLLIIILLFKLSNFTVSAQLPVKQHRDEKPLLFSSFSDRFEIPEALLQRFFSLNAGDTFNVSLPGNFPLRGHVLEKQNTEGGASINLRLQNFKDALFNLSKSTNADNTQVIRARVFHRQFADVLVLRLENGRYYLEKQEQRLVIAE